MQETGTQTVAYSSSEHQPRYLTGAAMKDGSLRFLTVIGPVFCCSIREARLGDKGCSP